MRNERSKGKGVMRCKNHQIERSSRILGFDTIWAHGVLLLHSSLIRHTSHAWVCIYVKRTYIHTHIITLPSILFWSKPCLCCWSRNASSRSTSLVNAMTRINPRTQNPNSDPSDIEEPRLCAWRVPHSEAMDATACSQLRASVYFVYRY